MTIAVIDYGAGNLQSVCNALTLLNQSFEIVTQSKALNGFEKAILPGVGAAGSAMRALEQRSLNAVIKSMRIPFLGICLGMQLLAEFSEEDQTECLGIIPGRVKKFPHDLKVPQIGWNRVQLTQESPLFHGIPPNPYFYFVNSYYVDAPEPFVSAQTLYGIDFPSVIQKNNFWGVQFHPEKSGENGLQMLRNFCERT